MASSVHLNSGPDNYFVFSMIHVFQRLPSMPFRRRYVFHVMNAAGPSAPPQHSFDTREGHTAEALMIASVSQTSSLAMDAQRSNIEVA